jgi:hypothetical protein
MSFPETSPSNECKEANQRTQQKWDILGFIRGENTSNEYKNSKSNRQEVKDVFEHIGGCSFTPI